MKIYFDLDCVTADFHGYINEKLGKQYVIGSNITPWDWIELRKNHQRMFRDLLPFKDTKKLINTLLTNGYDIAFLTALPYDGKNPWEYAPTDKINWVKENFPMIPCFLGPYAHDKKNHCNEDSSILIDDSISNNTDWVSVGGNSHLYRNIKDCIKFLKDSGVNCE